MAFELGLVPALTRQHGEKKSGGEDGVCSNRRGAEPWCAHSRWECAQPVGTREADRNAHGWWERTRYGCQAAT